MAKHKPGPWKLIEGSTKHHEMSKVVVDAAAGDEFVIGYVITDHANKEARAEDMANARLIAAAPELLAACEEAIAFLSQLVQDATKTVTLEQRLAGVGGVYTAQRIREAIAKAKS